MMVNHQRKPQNGFTLLEVILAFAMTAFLLQTIFSGISAVTKQRSHALKAYEITELARALLEEYAATYPMMADSGTFGENTPWRIAVQPIAPLGEAAALAHIPLLKAEITIGDITQSLVFAPPAPIEVQEP